MGLKLLIKNIRYEPPWHNQDISYATIDAIREIIIKKLKESGIDCEIVLE